MRRSLLYDTSVTKNSLGGGCNAFAAIADNEHALGRTHATLDQPTQHVCDRTCILTCGLYHIQDEWLAGLVKPEGDDDLLALKGLTVDHDDRDRFAW
jgi:hypothetical protein